jgi:lipoprotein-anchoring transpeptidase ErfK/SrfK
MLHDSGSSSIRMKVSRLLLAAAAVGLVVALGACTTVPYHAGNTSFSFDPPAQKPTNPSAVRLKLSTGAQRLYVVEGNTVLLATPVTVGTRSTPTPLGNFTIYSKVANRRRVSSPGAGYPMTYWMEFKPAYGLHWGFVKPYPSTHGCVRMPLDAARKTFALIRVGTPINIAPSQPWDATVGKTLPVLDDSKLADPPLNYMLSSRVFADAERGIMWNY